MKVSQAQDQSCAFFMRIKNKQNNILLILDIENFLCYIINRTIFC